MRVRIGFDALINFGLAAVVLGCDAPSIEEAHERTIAEEADSGDDDVGIEGAAYTFVGPVVTSLAGGQSRVYAVSVAAGETLVAHAVPDGVTGNVDVQLYDADPNAPFSLAQRLAASVRGAGYVDALYWSLPMGAAVMRYVRFLCVSGPCAFKGYVSVGDGNRLKLADVYLNQRSFTTASGKCKSSSGGTLADGECYCAPASAATRVVLDGKRRVDALREVATDLFGTNTSVGAADRTALMQRLREVYGYATCAETAYGTGMLATLKAALRNGSMVLFRSSRLTSAGHYVAVIGYELVAGRHRLTVDDPYGRWSATDVYTTNTTSQSSAVGRGQSYDYLDITNPSASIIVCR